MLSSASASTSSSSSSNDFSYIKTNYGTRSKNSSSLNYNNKEFDYILKQHDNSVVRQAASSRRRRVIIMRCVKGVCLLVFGLFILDEENTLLKRLDMLKPTFVDNQQQQQLKQPSSNYKRSNSSNVTKVVVEEEGEKAYVGFGLSHELKQHQQQHASSTVATTTPTTISDGRNSNIGPYNDSNNDMERINNATIEFVTIAIRNTVGIDINNETQHNNEHIGVPFPPTELYNISHHYFDGKVFLVGGEFLHFRRSNVDVQTTTTTMQQRSPPSSQSVAEKMKYLGRKLASNRPIKMVWLGGSNTEGRSPNPFVKQVHDMVHSQYPVYTYHTNISSLSSSSSSSSIQHALINKGMGGRTYSSFAKGFKSEFYYRDVKNTEIVM